MTTCSRRPWFGIVGILLGGLAVAAAILPFIVPLTATPKPRDPTVIERLQGIKDRVLARRHRVERVEPERNPPARNIAWFEILFATAITLGALAMIVAVVSLFAREPWRLGVTAAELGAGAIMIEVQLVLAVAIMFAAILTAFSDALDFFTP